MFIQTLLLLSFFVLNKGQNACDDPYAQYCPESSGWDVGICLQNLNDNLKEEFNAECKSFIDLHNRCKDDIETYCKGKEYTGDILPCLMEWTPIESISEDCVKSFPKKINSNHSKNTSKDSKKAKKNAEKRRR